ncbi:Scr1 family TA system antitoxin-like transcriptional regulator [Streptomyces sp. NPDC086023]|uniref:helix-turn-helix domain-containing protein n=1 Tax=Streptomyces sp. NPDC086023 TaxID=3365746 RepID=UPI0037D5A074
MHDDDQELAVDFFHSVGRQLKLLRERAELTQAELGSRLGYSEELISSVERGRRAPQAKFLEEADELLNAGGLLKAVIEDVNKAKAKSRVQHLSWFRKYAALEQEAEELNTYSSLVVHGLLQCEAYARALFASRYPMLDPETVDKRVETRLSRAEILRKWPPMIYSSILDEAALRQRFGGRQVWQEQLRHLLEIGSLRNVQLQVMPFSREEHAGDAGPFNLITPKGRSMVAYLEQQGYPRLIVATDEVRTLATRYGMMRSQALTPRESLAFIEKLLGEE